MKIWGKGSHMACFAKKREMDGCALWMIRDGLYISGLVGRETIHMGYVKQKLCSM